MHRNLQGVIQIFVRVVLRSIGRQKKDLHFILTLFQPGRYKLAMMHLQIIQDIVGTVYREAKADTLSYDAWNRFQHILPQVEDCHAWDRCLRIREALVEKGYPVSLVER